MKKCALCNGRLSKVETLCTNLKILGKHFPEGNYDVDFCNTCGLVQCTGCFSADDFLKYYISDVSTPFSYIKSKGITETYEYYEHILSEIEKYVDVNNSILDVGGAWGELAAFLINKGFKNVITADPNPKCVESMKSAGIECVQAEAETLNETLLGKNFDLIILNHILEHIVDLDKAMKSISSVVDDNGYVFIEVPDVEEYCNCSDSPFFYLTYEHVLHFSSNDIINLANKYGFEVISSKKYFKKISQYPSITAILKKSNTNNEISYSEIGNKSIVNYLMKCRNKMKTLTLKYAETGEPLILWGIGASTAQLLGGFEGCNIIQLIDANPMRQGLVYSVNGKQLEIQSPNMCGSESIVILSVPYEKAIRKYIRDIGLNNKIFTFCEK